MGENGEIVKKHEENDGLFALRLSKDGSFGDDHDARFRHREFIGILLQIESNRVSLRDPDAFIYNRPVHPSVSADVDPLHQDGIANFGITVDAHPGR